MAYFTLFSKIETLKQFLEDCKLTEDHFDLRTVQEQARTLNHFSALLSKASAELIRSAEEKSKDSSFLELKKRFVENRVNGVSNS